MTFVTSRSRFFLVNYNYEAQSLILCFITLFITKDLLHVTTLHKGSKAVMCSLPVHMTLFSLLTVGFLVGYFTGISDVTLI